MPRKPKPKGSRTSAAPDNATQERMLYYLKLTREAEWRIERVLYRQGKIVGGVYVGRGQEAIGVGSAVQLMEGDVVLPSHRDFSSYVIRGFSLREIFCNWMGRADGPTRGRENTLHIGNLERGVIPIISPLGDTLPVALGVGMVLKGRGKGNVVLVHFGEGSTSRGDVHEAMNWAGVEKLPVIFICNNNSYAYSTPAEKQYAVKNLSVRGPAYGMPGITADGTDVITVYQTVRKAIVRARRGQGPSFLEFKTFRMTGHSAHDAAEYVPEKIKKQGRRKDPVRGFEKFLLGRRLITRERIQQLEEAIRKEIDDAVTYAEASPLPEGSTALEGVYCQADCWWEKALSVVPAPPAFNNGPRTTDAD